MKTLFIASSNQGKIKEMKALLGTVPYLVTSALELPDKIEVEETGQSYRENALLKAEAYRKLVKGLIVGEDSGLEIRALDNKPGLYSARWLGEEAGDQEKNMEILRLLADVKDRRACFITLAALLAEDGTVTYFEGRVEGTIAYDQQGTNGFGYDPLFILPDGRRMAVISSEEKNLVSHRARAFKQVAEYLRRREDD